MIWLRDLDDFAVFAMLRLMADGGCFFILMPPIPIPRRLRTQTSVMNGSLAAENMDVDKVCDAGGIFDVHDDDDGDGDGPASSRVRWGKESVI